MDEAFQLLERTYLAKKRFPELMEFKASQSELTREIFNDGCFYPTERDENGRRIIIIQCAKFNLERFAVFDCMKLIIAVNSVLLEEEETQIAGVVTVVDYANMTVKSIATVSPSDVRLAMSFERQHNIIRNKAVYILNLPSFARTLFDLTLSFVSEKQRSRVIILKSVEELKNYINPSLLPTQYGGTQTEAAMLENFRKIADDKEEIVRKQVDFYIDWGKVSNEKLFSKEHEETFGSFRKLEID